jgi:hypothetical protein
MNKTAQAPAISDETRSVYEGMSTERLRLMQTAFRLDNMESRSRRSAFFCEGRLALIAEILAKRGVPE